MNGTESAVKIQGEDEDVVVSVVQCSDDITINGLVVLNVDGSSIDD